MITSTREQYFEFNGFGHFQGCKSAPLWEVAHHTELSFQGEFRRRTFRLVCRTCGAAYLEAFDHDSVSFHGTTVQQIGYGAPAVRLPNTGWALWAHPGRRLFYDDPEPEVYLVTASKQPPAEESEVLGAIGWQRGPRGGNAWRAYVGYNPTSEQSPTLKTRRAAAVWLAGRLADRGGAA